MEIINLTPHKITILDSKNNIQRVIAASGRIARLSVKIEKAFVIDNVQITKTVFGEPVDLPKAQWIAEHAGTFNTTYGHGFSKRGAQEDCAAKCYKHFSDCIAYPLTYYIVSQIIKSRFPEREDLLVPAEMQRDNDGNIIGCRSLGI